MQACIARKNRNAPIFGAKMHPMDAAVKIEREINTSGRRPERSDIPPPTASMSAVIMAKPATDKLTSAKSAPNVAAMFGSDGKIIFIGRAARADSNIRVIRRGGAVEPLPIASVPWSGRKLFSVIVASVSQ
jgi:hypothetical protein